MTTINVFKDPLAEEIWKTTYKNHEDNTIQDTWRRVATAIASAESTQELKDYWSEQFYEMMSDFKVVPGGRILVNAGAGWRGATYMNCYVGPLPDYDIDSIDAIYKVLADQANTLKSEGGWGMNFSWLRPRGSFIEGVGVESPGAVKFMELFDKSSEIVTSGSGKASKNSRAKGKIRKGAMMGVLDVWHPDIIEFITAKQTPGRLTKFNVSVNCTDDFMEQLNDVQVIQGRIAEIQEMDESEFTSPTKQECLDNLTLALASADYWALEYPDTTHPFYSTEWRGNLGDWKKQGYPVVVHNETTVTKIWDMIMKSTYARNEPGVLFLDRADYYNPLNYYESILATNPCGEQTLAAGGVCDLGTINLTQFIREDKQGFDIPRVTHYVKKLVRFLDNVNSLSEAPLPEYKDSMDNKRRVGCGVMGYGSSLYIMKVAYGSERAAAIRDELLQAFAKAAYEASIDLAEEKGMFTYCDPEKHALAPFIQSLDLSQEYLNKLTKVGIRNSALLSNQPNGNSSLLCNIISGGIEPVFMAYFIRTKICPTIPDEIRDVTPNYPAGIFEETEFFKWHKEGDEQILRGVTAEGKVYKIDRSRGLTEEIPCIDYGVKQLMDAGEWDETAEWAKTTESLTVNDHVSELEGFARWVDSACSKTCNIPNDYPYEDFKDLYLNVYNTGIIKGFTTYRAGTMASVLSAKEEAKAEPEDEEIILDETKLPDSLPCTLKTLKAEGRKWYLTLVLDESQKRPVALFANTNSAEKNTTANDAVEKLRALAVAKGIPTEHIESVLRKVGNDSNTTKICRFISLNLRHGVLVKNVVHTLDEVDCLAGSFVFHIRKFLATWIKDGEKVTGLICPECNSVDTIVYQEGCKICKNCGNSKCG